MAPIDSWLGALDDAYFLLRYGLSGRAPALFRRGWGSDAAIEAVLARFGSRGQPLEVTPVWHGDWRKRTSHRSRDGGFPTPLYRQFLPPESDYARFRFLMPRDHTDQVVVMVPTRFEEDYSKRELLAVQLAQRGIGSLLLENPFMGSRRPAYQPTVMLATLSDFLLLGGTVIEEARSVTQWLQQQGFRNLCITGLSQGGYFAAVAGALAAPPVAIVTLLAPHNGNVVYIDGLSRGLCDWPRLQKSCVTAGPVVEKVRAVFDAIDLEHIPEPAGGTRVIAIAASHDRFVPPDSFRKMGLLWPSTDVRWVGGGHISTVLRRSIYLAAILDALRPGQLDFLADSAPPTPA